MQLAISIADTSLIKLMLLRIISRGILHDPVVYPDPMVFNPERYFSSSGVLDFSANDPEKYAFGYGRRCAMVIDLHSGQRESVPLGFAPEGILQKTRFGYSLPKLWRL